MYALKDPVGDYSRHPRFLDQILRRIHWLLVIAKPMFALALLKNACLRLKDCMFFLSAGSRSWWLSGPEPRLHLHGEVGELGEGLRQHWPVFVSLAAAPRAPGLRTRLNNIELGSIWKEDWEKGDDWKKKIWLKERSWSIYWILLTDFRIFGNF